MKIYLDICALKRPWDDQRQPRIAAETAIVVTLLDLAERGELTLVRSPAHDSENARNTDAGRAAAIAEWLAKIELPSAEPAGLEERARTLVRAGLRPFDSLHLAWAEALSSDALVTTDDRFIKRAAGRAARSRTRVVNPADVLKDVNR